MRFPTRSRVGKRAVLSRCGGASDKGVRDLGLLKELRSLNLENTRVTDTGVKDIAALGYHGFETFPETLLKLFTGENTGKLVLEVADIKFP